MSITSSPASELLRSNEGYCQIVSLVPGGPADKSKQIKPGDKIIAVAQGEEEAVDVVEMKLNKVVQMIRGELNTRVRLTVIPAKSVDGSGTKEVVLLRDRIELKDQFAKARIITMKDEKGVSRRLGVLTVPQYYENVASDTAKLLKRLDTEQVEGIALDLRKNGGGFFQRRLPLRDCLSLRALSSRFRITPNRRRFWRMKIPALFTMAPWWSWSVNSVPLQQKLPLQPFKTTRER